MADNGFFVPERAMVIVAHPDDIEFGSAGTIARWVQEGAEVCYVLCTSGDVGIANTDYTREEVREIREAEQRAAAEVVGVHEVIFLREPDGELENTLALRKKLVREIRRFKPDTVMTLDPTIVFVNDGWINHPDHRAAGGAAIDAVFPACGQPHVFQELEEEGLTAHKVKRVYVSGWQNPNTYVNITSTMDLKLQALQAHVSQMDEMRGQNPDFDVEKMLRAWSKERGKGIEMEYAEAYRVIKLG